MKKLITLTLSLLMALSLCLTISAEDNNYYEIGDNKYPSLEEALTAIYRSGISDATIKLIATRTETGSGNGSSFSIDSGKNIVLDLNGNTLTLDNYTIACKGNLTITGNGQIEFTGWNSSSNYCINVAHGGTFTLESGKIISQNDSSYKAIIYAYVSYSGAGKVIINGGSIESSGNVACIKAKNSGATAEVNGGTFKGSNIFVEENGGKITVSSGTYSNDVSGYLADGYRIIYQEDSDSPFKVVKNDEKVTVESTTGAMSSEARTELNGKTISGDNFNTTVNTSTQLYFEVNEGSSSLDLEELIKEAIGSNYNWIATPLEIKLNTKENGAKKEISKVGDNEKIPVTLYLKETDANTLNGKDIKIKVIKIDDDGSSLVEDATGTLSGNVLTFYCANFSDYTYFITYPVSSSGNTDSDTNTNTNTNTNTSTKSYDAKDKNKDGVVSCEEEMNSANWVWSDTKQACVYKVTNTSVK